MVSSLKIFFLKRIKFGTQVSHEGLMIVKSLYSSFMHVSTTFGKMVILAKEPGYCDDGLPVCKLCHNMFMWIEATINGWVHDEALL